MKNKQNIHCSAIIILLSKGGKYICFSSINQFRIPNLTSKLAEDSHLRMCPLTDNDSVLPFHCGILDTDPKGPIAPLRGPGAPDPVRDLNKSSDPRLFSKDGGEEISRLNGIFLKLPTTPPLAAAAELSWPPAAHKLGLGGTGGGLLSLDKSVRDPPKGVERPEDPLIGVGILDLKGLGVKIVAGNEATDKDDPSLRNILMSDSPTVFKD